jgi:hypothetical protein
VADDDLLAAADALERELEELDRKNNDLLDRLDGPWNELRAIGGLPEANLRRSIADDPATRDSRR